ncbi:DUF2325 domain-containing protein [Sporomusa sp. KB1]|jgi:hypothetical protein|uniref:DUF2325 domain-containing protein n=1 Tax=Sporomusa sp. KB1 TaxID=943346 RepID=UPI0011A30773|nr:DUF2325 domain-containing protein [Sporomusa sp. KB1]TWH46673.1 hypothetical protein Salpa_2678 [Sporomusa sp. KB1]
MSVVVVGGDYLGSIEKNLYSIGVTELVHISGRKTFDKNKMNLPKNTAFVLVLTDYVNHGTAKNAKLAAKSQSIPLIFAKRSWRFVEEKLRDSKFI